MRHLGKLAILLVVMAAPVGTSLAQGPLQKQVNFTINVPYRMRMQNYLLPAGTYILYQISKPNPNLFALYEGDMMHSPIAMIHTVRIDYLNVDVPGKTAMHWRIDEFGSSSDPVITGWDIPGMDGWQIVSVVPKKGRNPLTRVPY
ncbi:MAG TPA: hypothetical protein VGV87_27310 [Blastocatellia bacterium]|nr:hypothetical protein [Blastocatellia bacterium]